MDLKPGNEPYVYPIEQWGYVLRGGEWFLALPGTVVRLDDSLTRPRWVFSPYPAITVSSRDGTEHIVGFDDRQAEIGYV